MRRITLLAVLSALAGCGEAFEPTMMATIPTEEADASDAQTAPDAPATADVGVDADGPAPCPVGMVRHRAFCIDQTEVTSAAFGGTDGMRPATEMTWTQASNYCASVGKHLCSGDDWQAACSGDGATVYPYGDAFDPAACQTSQDGTAPVASHVKCATVDGAFDMSGNVWEWTDDCGPTFCGLRGGGWRADVPESMSCGHVNATQGKAYASDTIGFRCCAG